MSPLQPEEQDRCWCAAHWLHFLQSRVPTGSVPAHSQEGLSNINPEPPPLSSPRPAPFQITRSCLTANTNQPRFYAGFGKSLRCWFCVKNADVFFCLALQSVGLMEYASKWTKLCCYHFWPWLLQPCLPTLHSNNTFLS